MNYRTTRKRITNLLRQYHAEIGLLVERPNLDQCVDRIFEILKLSGFRKVREDKFK